MTIRRRRIVIVALLILGGVTMFGIPFLSRQRPEVGPQDGRLRPCPPSPNCVCSFDTDDEHRIAPIDAGPQPAERFDQLHNLMRSLPRAQIVNDEGTYLHAEFTTPLLRFVDDVEFLLDESAGVIHVRSASRIGHSDFGANRDRVEMLRQRLADEPHTAE